MTLLIDDQVLAAYLRGANVLDSTAEDVFTTGYWYVRLCMAIARKAGGSLSGPFAALPEPHRQRAVSAVLQLPDEIAMLDVRWLGPLIGELADRHPPMNILTREALASAVELNATVVLASGNENPALLSGLVAENLCAEIVFTS